MKRIFLCVGAIVACLSAASVASASAIKTSPSISGTMTLDSYYNWGRQFTPPIATSGKLATGSYDVATVVGTFSYYAAVNYSDPQSPWNVVCGRPEPRTQIPGSLGGDGPVGFDAQFVFARPWKTKKCARVNLPVHWHNFQMNDGIRWSHPRILNTSLTAPTSNHTYDYAVVGHGRRIRFRLSDILTRDNYGLLHITLRPATSADCISSPASYAAFGFANATGCETALHTN